MSKVAVVASGGMDSATLAWHYRSLGHDVHMIGFDYGQRHSKELDYLRKQAEYIGAEITVVNMGFMADLLKGSSLTQKDIEVPDGHYAAESMRITVVPNRNAIMISIATGIAQASGAEIVATGIHAGDHYIYPDCRPAFFEPMNDAMRAATMEYAHEDFHLEAPFIEMSKAEIAEYGEQLGVRFDLTWSCYKGLDFHCGTCGTCYERREAFQLAKVEDPTIYHATPEIMTK